jgi:beta-galactosidase/beta-glucuronidase
MLQRDQWATLNGPWSFALDREGSWTHPGQVIWDERKILVPFAPETARSGIQDVGFYSACWYQRRFVAPLLRETERVILHFGAIDYEATVWMDDAVIAQHRGGYTPFEVDITSYVAVDRVQTLTVRAHDDPHDLAKPRGKQDWQLEPHSIWYRRTTGVWQTVWVEIVPATRIVLLRCEASLERWEIDIEAELGGPTLAGAELAVTLKSGDTILADDVYAVVGGAANRAIRLSDPGIDDSRNELLWNPGHPRLITVDVKLRDRQGTIIDAVRSYTALRAVSVEGDRFLLNGRPFFLRMVLDQGYWPETGMTPPDDAAVRADVELAKAMGFNGVRKHQKIEDPRYLYWADVLGLLVWEEMPSAYRFTKRSVERLTKEWINVLERDRCHPCIVAWVPINESWGVPNLPRSPTERDYVRALYHLTKTLDPSRPVIGNDGWESVATDIVGIHDYDDDPSRIARKYHADEVLPRLFRRERPAGRLLVLEGQRSDLPLVLSEFGGIAFGSEKDTWGYSRCLSLDEFGVRYAQLLEVVRSLGLLCGFCYTQFADTYQEANGLLYADRTPKLPLEFISAATRGPRSWPLFLQEGPPNASSADE